MTGPAVAGLILALVGAPTSAIDGAQIQMMRNCLVALLNPRPDAPRLPPRAADAAAIEPRSDSGASS